MADMKTPTEAYGNLSPAERAQLAQEFLNKLHEQHDKFADKFAALDLNTITPAQLAELHDHVAHNHPGIFGEVMKHPVLTAALAGFAVYEIDKHVANR